MSESIRNLSDPIEREALLRAEVLFAADSHEQDAETLDRPARAHAVDQYIQWSTDDGDMPLPTKRIRLVPSRPELIVDDVAEAYVNYPVDRKLFVDGEHRSQLVFIRIVTAAGASLRFIVTPDLFRAFNGNDDLEVDPLLLELNSFSEQDPGSIFIAGTPEDEADTMTAAEHLLRLSKIIREYKLKAQPLDFYSRAS